MLTFGYSHLPASGVRKRPRQARARQTVAAILDAAAELFARDGYAAVTTNHVAARAGVSIGSLYQYFGDKDELVAALAERHVVQATAALQALLDGLGGAPLDEVITVCVQAVVADHAAEPELHRLLASAPRHEALEATLQRGLAWFAAALAPRLAGRDPELRASLVVELVFALVHGALLVPPLGRGREAVVADITRIAIAAARA